MKHAYAHRLICPNPQLPEISKLGAAVTSKPVKCLTDGLEFSSKSAAARYYGLHPESVRNSYRLGKAVKGLKFELIN